MMKSVAQMSCAPITGRKRSAPLPERLALAGGAALGSRIQANAESITPTQKFRPSILRFPRLIGKENGGSSTKTPLNGSETKWTRMSRYSTYVNSLSELQWAHQTVMRIISIVSQHSYLDERRVAAIHHLTKGTLWLESIIQEQSRTARRRATDEPGGTPPPGPAKTQRPEDEDGDPGLKAA